jgi:hypothetical protein
VIKASDKMIAKRADMRARADFATWKMMAKLNGTASLSIEAQAYLDNYSLLLKDMPETEATDATIKLVSERYYSAMGGTGSVPDVPIHRNEPVSDNVVTPFKRPAKKPSKPSTTGGGSGQKTGLPVALIFAGLLAAVVGLKYFLS